MSHYTSQSSRGGASSRKVGNIDPKDLEGLQLPEVEGVVFGSTPPSEHNAFSELAQDNLDSNGDTK